ncbi:MAG: HAMP domain-containing protein, partial [Anaerolineae bacterium]|nr:HAMP domain-containing protein [Anaerolineae bacterium]
MLRSLRARLFFSHILPLLVVIPVVGFSLNYLLKTQVLLAGLSNELETQASLVAFISTDPQIWNDPEYAQAFITQVGPRISARVMFLSPDGILMASNDPNDLTRLGQQIEIAGLREAVLTGRPVRIDYGERAGSGTAEVIMPVVTISFPPRIVGVIRMTDPLSSVYERFPKISTFIAWVLAAGFVVGGLLGLGLAWDLSKPLARATRSISKMADGQPLSSLPEQGPEEIRLLLRAFNTLTVQLRSLEKSRQRLLANLVHELGRPLGALLSATQALASGAHQDPVLRQELLDGMTSEVERMQHLLDDLTRLYDQAMGPLELNLQPTALEPWLTQVLSPWREAAQEKSLTWDMTLPDDLPVLSLDADRMAQALGNIVSNAIKYTSTGG